MLVEVEAGWRFGDCPEGEIAHKILCAGHADQCAGTSRGVDQGVYTINPATGAGTLVGMTSAKDLVGDLAFRTVAEPPAGLDLNQHGLTGSWYEPATSG